MTDDNLLTVHQTLEAKRRELEGRRGRREEILIEVTADELERMQQTVNREVAIQNIDREAGLLKDVIAAMLHLSEGTYGVCSYCETEIPENRLRAVPWAARCVICQEFLDRTRPRNIAEGRDWMA